LKGCRRAYFLLNVHAAKAYFDARIRVIFVGQETKGWICRLPEALEDPKNCVPTFLARYEKGLLADLSHSHFLRIRLLLERKLTGGILGSVIWNNLFKIDVYRGKGKSRNARNHSRALAGFSAKLFCYECELFWPDVIIFGYSATHDAVVKSLFEALIFFLRLIPLFRLFIRSEGLVNRSANVVPRFDHVLALKRESG
jgi:hypothetical protein